MKSKKEKAKRRALLKEIQNTNQQIRSATAENTRLQTELNKLSDQLKNLDPSNPGWVRLEQSLRALARSSPTRSWGPTTLALLATLAMLIFLTVDTFEKEGVLNTIANQAKTLRSSSETLLGRVSDLERSLDGLPETATEIREEVLRMTGSERHLKEAFTAASKPLDQIQTDLTRLTKIVTSLQDSVAHLNDHSLRLARIQSAGRESREKEVDLLKNTETALGTLIGSIADLDSNLLAVRAEILELRQSVTALEKAALEKPVDAPATSPPPKRIDY